MATVLLAESNRMIRTMYAAGLGGYGYRVYEASNVAQALTYLEDGVQPDVLLLDWNLPDGSAEDLILAVQSVVPNAPVRVIVAAGQPESVTCKADHILPKNTGVMDILALM